MNSPKVSVVIPTYNHERYIAAAVESVLSQTYRDHELIVVDDGSTDNTRAILAPYLDRIVYLHQENQGESVARNHAIRMARGEYVAFLDSDDLWLPNKLQCQVAAMDTSPEAVLVYSYSYVVNTTGDRILYHGREQMGQGEQGLHNVFGRLVLNDFIVHSTVLVRAKSLADTDLFDSMIQWGEDWDLWLRLALKGPFAFVPDTLACYRLHYPERRLRIEASDEFVRQNELILRKVFDTLPTSHAQLLRLQPLAFEALYLRSAIYNYELGDLIRGPHYMNLAMQCKANLTGDPCKIAERLVQEGFRIAEERGSLVEGIGFVKRVFGYLPPSAKDLRAIQSRTLSGIYTAAAFSCFAQGNRAATLRHVIQALCSRPASARDRGLLSIGVQSLIGGKPWPGRGGRG